ncbi:RsmB/NOP family class I SAM-dependent RNA methyltransferase [Thermoanaerobacterium saccharolyticum]|uniref:RsmB/NOP family class I SAM-dependent RNA methyltransferase n=1 Tax=Thermoanaerobacterium saccharolyticum TaxID=28896 RepID=UPI002FD8E649
MIMKIKEDFVNKMRFLLKDDFEKFMREYEKEPYRGLRVNTLKISVDEFLRISPFRLISVPWCDTGFYYDQNDKPGKHYYHDAGLFYIQEPSAMAVVEALNPVPGDIVLDLSAAPGGKSTHIASKLNGEGLLVSNEINSKRVKVLAENIERMGIRNAVILNESPEKLEKTFKDYFDKILVDAPCSGEGMFRKDETARDEWSLENVLSCAYRQKKILDSASCMLKPGGIMVYSTCTFSPEENEGVIDYFLKNHSDFELIEIYKHKGFDNGHPEWANGCSDLRKCVRLWPHLLKGEGHFIAKLRKKGSFNECDKVNKKLNIKKTAAKDLFYDFGRKHLNLYLYELNLQQIGQHVYHVPYEINLSGLRVFKPGFDLGQLKKERFEPSHWLAMSLKKDDVKMFYDLKGKEIESYIHGETLNVEIDDGWVLLTIDGYSIGWGKAVKGVIKNFYPKSLRK